MFKKIIAFIICFLYLSGILNFSSFGTSYVNSKGVRSYIKYGITMVAVRDFFESAGNYSVSWNAKERTAVISGDGFEMYVGAGKGYSLANGRGLCRYITNETINDTLYFPITVAAKALGLNVSWNSQTKTAAVNGKISPILTGEKYYERDDLYYLARIIEAEAGIEPFFGKTAVGNVIINRKNSSEFPNSVKDVIYDTKYGVQFTPVANGTVNNSPTEESIIAAKCTLDGFYISKEVLYFLNPYLSTSSWIVNNRIYCFTIGTHDFYS